MENLDALAQVAFGIVKDTHPTDHPDGRAMGGGFYWVSNTAAFHTRSVIRHVSGWVFKDFFGGFGSRARTLEECYSGVVIAEVVLDDDLYPIRYPEFRNYRDLGLVAQEYVQGYSCVHGPGGLTCEHTDAIRKATGLRDTHTGNWLINHEGEVVFFDYE